MTAIQIMVPDDVEQKVYEVAKRQHISLQELMTMALLEKLSTIPDPELEKRAARGKRKDFDDFMAQVPDVPPEDYDKLN